MGDEVAPASALRVPRYIADGKGGVTGPPDPLLTTCSTCACPATDRCLACQCVAYCGRACQRVHWRAQHKRQCGELAAANYLYIRTIADAGNASAMFDVGQMLEKGLGTPKCAASALVRYRASEVAGCLSAPRFIGHLLSNGAEGVARDVPGGRRAFLRGAEAGDAISALNLGLQLSYGKGGPVDGVGALRWLAFAAEHAESERGLAFLEMGRIHCFGVGGARRDYSETERCYTAGANAGNAECAMNLTLLLGSGGETRRGRVDRASARAWAKRAVELGSSASEISELLQALGMA